MNNFVGPEIHDDQEDQITHSYTVEKESQESQKNQSKKKAASSPYHVVLLPQDDAVSSTAQNKLTFDVEETLNNHPKFLFCATPAKTTANDDDVTESFVSEFNAHRGNQEMLAQARKMLHKTRSLAGLEVNTKYVDISSARRNFFLLAQLDHLELKMAALDNLILVLQHDQVSKQTAFDLLDLAIDLMKQMDRELIQTQLIDHQIKICQAYGMVAELIQWHYGKKHIGGITSELKKQLLITLDTLKDLNTHEDPSLNFAASYALEGFKRLKDDRKELFELGERAYRLLSGIVGAYRNSNQDYMKELELAFKGIDIRIKQSWYDASSIFNSLARQAFTNKYQLIALQTMLRDNWHDLNWKFTYNVLQKLGEIAVYGSTPEIRKAALEGQQIDGDALPGLLDFQYCTTFKKKMNRKPLVHLKLPVEKDNNIAIRSVVAQELVHVSQESPDVEIRRKAKNNLIEFEKNETNATALNSIRDVIPQDYESRQHWLTEKGKFTWNSSSSAKRFADHSRAPSNSIQELASQIIVSNQKDTSSLSTTTPIEITSPAGKKPRKPISSKNSPEKKSSRSSSSSPTAKSAPEKYVEKPKRLSGYKKEKNSRQSILLAKSLNSSPETINQYIEFNQDIHLLDDNTLQINKAGMKKILGTLTQIQETASLNFSRCKIQSEGVDLLVQKLPKLGLASLLMPPGLTKEVGLDLAKYFKSEPDFAINFAKSQDDFLFGTILIDKGLTKDAIIYFEKALEKIEEEDVNDEFKAQVYLKLGEALIQEEEYAFGEKNLLKAYKLHSTNKNITTALAHYYYHQGNYRESLKYAEVAAITPKFDAHDLNEKLITFLNKQIGKKDPNNG